MHEKAKLIFQTIVAIVLLVLILMLITGGMILFKGIGTEGTFTYMIVLGNKSEGSEPSPLLQDRIAAAAKYMEENPDVIAVASGYQSKGADISEAQCIYNGLTALGIAPERILLEEQATSTSENFLNSLELLEQELGSIPDEIGILTNEFQLLRADMIARDCGLEPINIAAATSDTRAFMTYFVREIFMVWYDGLKLALT